MKTEAKVEPPRHEDTKAPAPLPPQNSGELKQIKLSLIAPSRTNPRKDFNADKLTELGDSIKAQGIRVPILVRPIKLMVDSVIQHGKKLTPVWELWSVERMLAARKSEKLGGYTPESFATEKEAEAALKEGRFELVDGERRFRAAQSIRLDTVPCIVQALTDTEAREIQLLSFVREQLSDLEAARGYQNLIQQHGYTAEALRAKLGLAKATFYGRMTILKASPKVLDALAAGDISQSHVQKIVSVPDIEHQDELVQDVIANGYSVRDLDAVIEQRFVAYLDKAPFSIKATYPTALIPAPCEDCEFRGANAKERFPTLALRPNACLNPKCFASKVAAKQVELAEELKAKGFKVLTEEQTLAAFPNSWDQTPRQDYFTAENRMQFAGGAWMDLKTKLGKNLKKLPKHIAFRGGATVELYDRKDVAALFEKEGIKLYEPPKPKPVAKIAGETKEQEEKRLAWQKKAQEKEKAAAEKMEQEEKVKEAAQSRIIGALVEAVEKAKDLKPIADYILYDCVNAYGGARALERRGLVKPNLPSYQRTNSVVLFKAAEKFSSAQLLGLIVEVISSEDCGRSSLGKLTEELASDLKVDVKAIRKTVAAELAAAAKAPPEKSLAKDAKPAKAKKGKAAK